MQEFVIICDMYFGPVGKFAIKPEKTATKFEYDRATERHLFMEKWEYLLKEDYYYENVRTFLTDYTNLKITELTNKYEELKNAI